MYVQVQGYWCDCKTTSTITIYNNYYTDTGNQTPVLSFPEYTPDHPPPPVHPLITCIIYTQKHFRTFGNEANTCCLTSHTIRSVGNCKHFDTFNSGTWMRTRSHPSRCSGGGESSSLSNGIVTVWSIMVSIIFSHSPHFVCCCITTMSISSRIIIIR